MDECSLDWKKVFKEILGDKKLKADNDTISSAEQCDNELSLNMSNFNENKLSESCTLNTSQQKNSFTGKHSEIKSNPKSCHFQKDATNFIGSGVKLQHNAKISPDNAIPEWNKAFKKVLGSNPPVHAQEQKSINDRSKAKSVASQKYPVPVWNKRRYYPKKKYHSASKAKMAEELDEVTKFFASSVLLKPEILCQSLNDLAGTGVDIFKQDKRLTYSLSETEIERKSDSYTEYVKQKTSKMDVLKSDNTTKLSSKSKQRVHFEDDCTTEEYLQPDFPSGWVAKMKPLTSADILNAPIIPFDEPAWDDDLLYY